MDDESDTVEMSSESLSQQMDEEEPVGEDAGTSSPSLCIPAHVRNTDFVLN